MKQPFSSITLRFLLLAQLGTAGLLATSCKEDPQVSTPDYASIDEDIIKKYIADNKITNAQRHPSGLYYVPVTSVPTGVQATAGKTVSVLYTGMFMNGTVFDASSQHGNTPISFVLGKGEVIRGWDEGIALMRKGEKAILLIPSALAYGPSGRSSIPPNAILRFEVELTDVK
jgi:FKBP-type peptidyl-prolyl cis-trans isomerase